MATPGEQPTRLRLAILARPLIGWVALAACTFAPGLHGARAEDAAPSRAGRLVKVRLPIRGDDDQRVIKVIERAVEDLPEGDPRPVLVLEFTVREGEAGEESQFSRSLALANYLTSPELTKQVKTVAYLPQSVKGHAVLVVAACEEIHMAPDAELGQAGIQAGTINVTTVTEYEMIAKRRATLPRALLLGMLQAQHVVLRVETENTTEYIFRRDLAALKKTKTLRGEPKVLIKQGELGNFSGEELRRMGRVKFLASDRESVTRYLELPPGALTENPLFGGQWNAVRIELSGPVTINEVERITKIIDDQVNQNDVNFICLEINSAGGSLGDSLALANYLADLDPGRVRTVAYVPRQARADAALIAMACDHLIMHSGAELGGSGERTFDKKQIKTATTVIREFAKRKSRSWSLPVALIDPTLIVHRYTRFGRQGPLTEYLCEEEFQQKLSKLPDADKWKLGEAVTFKDELRTMQAEQAKLLGLATEVVENFTQFKDFYRMEESPRDVRPGWALELIEAIGHRELRWILLMIAIAAMYAEMQMPGLGIAGFLSGICFMLYFWSQYLNHTAEWLEILLFLAGVACLLVEVFVLPGFGVFGIGGGALVLASVVLASQTFVIPTNEYQITQFRDSLVTVGAALFGFIFLAVLIHRYLPRTPVLGNVVLQPVKAETMQQRDAVVDLQYLKGMRGTTTTLLRPAGVARFDDRLVHVVSDSQVVASGTDVIVVQVQGNHVVVRQAEGGES